MAGHTAWFQNLPDMFSIGLLSMIAAVLGAFYLAATTSPSLKLRAVLLCLDGGLLGFGLWLFFR